MKIHPNAAQVEADTRAWLEKAVIGLNLCPFAKSAYVKNQVRIVVVATPHLDALLEALDEELDYLAAADPDQVDTTLLVHPDLLQDFEDYNEFLTLADQAVEEHGLEGVLQVASFHPHYQFADTEPDDITNFSNRSPYPTLHLLREDSITRAVEVFPEAEMIFGRNMETLEKLGSEGWNALGLAVKASQLPK